MNQDGRIEFYKNKMDSAKETREWLHILGITGNKKCLNLCLMKEFAKEGLCYTVFEQQDRNRENAIPKI